MAALDDFLLQEGDLVSIFIDQLRTATGHPAQSLMACVAYHIWLSMNALIFTLSRCTAGVIVERARANAEKYVSSVSTSKNWAFTDARWSPRQVFFSWEPPPPRYLSISFDGSVKGMRGGANFVIRKSGLGIVVARGSFLIEPTIPVAELQGA